MTIKGIIFDIGGVLIDYHNSWYIRYISKKLGKKPDAVENAMYTPWVAFESGKITKADFEARMAKALGAEPKDIRWFEFFKEMANTNEDAVGLVKDLHGRGYVTAVLSNIDKARWSYVARMHWIALMDYRFASCYIGLRKPQKAAYLYAARKMDIAVDEILFIDDKPENVAGARESGMHGILFRSVRKLEAELPKFGI